jgi:hypothetical protein
MPTCPFNEPFTVPAFTPPVATGFTADDLKPQKAPDSTIHPVTACALKCNQIADAKYEECKMKIKQFTEMMNSQGCSGTWCTTAKKRSCPR